MAELGSLINGLSLFTSLLAVSILILGIRRSDPAIIEMGYRALRAVLLLAASASLILMVLLAARYFQVDYVYQHTSRDLPLLYTLSSFWAGQEGSLLLWEVILAGLTTVVLWRHRDHLHLPIVAAILGSIQVFFTFLVTFVSSPFVQLPFFPSDGRGLNPLLQNPGMLLHPPTQYLGYVGFTVPYAFAMAALIRGQTGPDWIRTTRRWTIISWLFLTVGIVTGGRWAYVELGWGGYWAWDPVENASFMPWAVATAFLHSVMIQQSKGMLKGWNVSLIALTFLLTIFGTFLTRSGIVQSVHSFDQSLLGVYFLGFLATIALFSGYLIVTRGPLLRDRNSFEGILSKESTFLLNNLLFLGLAFATFWGTVFPILSEILVGRKITIGAPFFNQVNGPIFLAVLFLTGVCPLVAWRRCSIPKLGRNLLISILAGLLGAVTVNALWKDPFLSLTAGAGSLVTASILHELWKELRVRRTFHPREGALRALKGLVLLRNRKYGGYAVHFGVVVMALGIMTSSTLKQEATVTLTPGSRSEFAGFSLLFQGLEIDREGDVQVTKGVLVVNRSDGPSRGNRNGLARLRPARIRHPNDPQAHSEVDIHRFGMNDLYAILAGFGPAEANGKRESFATFKVLYQPGIHLIWIGFYFLLGGGLFALLPPRKGSRRESL